MTDWVKKRIAAHAEAQEGQKQERELIAEEINRLQSDLLESIKLSLASLEENYPNEGLSVEFEKDIILHKDSPPSLTSVIHIASNRIKVTHTITKDVHSQPEQLSSSQVDVSFSGGHMNLRKQSIMGKRIQAAELPEILMGSFVDTVLTYGTPR